MRDEILVERITKWLGADNHAPKHFNWCAVRYKLSCWKISVCSVYSSFRVEYILDDKPLDHFWVEEDVVVGFDNEISDLTLVFEKSDELVICVGIKNRQYSVVSPELTAIQNYL